MTHTPSRHGSDGQSSYFAFERLDAYQLSRQIVQFVAKRRGRLRGLPGRAGEQLNKAVVGAHTNSRSGSAAQGAEQKRPFRIALTEATEIAGAADVALDYGAFSQAEYDALRLMLGRLCACLRGLSR